MQTVSCRTCQFATRRVSGMTCIMSQQLLTCYQCRSTIPRFHLSSLRLPVSSSLGDRNQSLQEDATDSSPLQKIKSGRSSRSLSAAVTRLRKSELVQEMQLRGLPETGTRPDLRERLLKAVETEQRLVAGALILLKPLLTTPFRCRTDQAVPIFADAAPAAQPDSALQASHQPCQSKTHPAAHGQDVSSSPSQAQQPGLQVQEPFSGSRQQGAAQFKQQRNVKQDSATNNRPSSQSAVDTMPSASNRQKPSQQSTPAQPSNLTLVSTMSVTWLGTSSGSPSMRRNVSSIALCHGQCTYLVDCGEGSSRQVLRSHINPASISGIYISHLHGDHCFGLPGMIELISRAHIAAGAERGSRQLTIQGPPGIQQLVKSALAVSLCLSQQ